MNEKVTSIMFFCKVLYLPFTLPKKMAKIKITEKTVKTNPAFWVDMEIDNGNFDPQGTVA